MKKLFSQVGFTLVELMIVIAIIGILAVALFPSLSGYLERSRDLDYQVIAKNWISLVEQYRIDHDEVIDSQANQTSSSNEIYCIAPQLDATCSFSQMHFGLSQFFSGTTDGIHALQDVKRMPFYSPSASGAFLVRKVTPAYDAVGGVYYPGFDPTSTTKIEMLIWGLEGTSGYSSGGTSWKLTVSGSYLGGIPDKRCAPGFASIIRKTATIERTTCTYIFK